jgi:hypothetical protein
MNTQFLIQGKEHVTINSAAILINCKVPLIYYHIGMGRLKMVEIDKLKLIELDSVHDLNIYLQFRYKKQSNEK